MVWYTYDRREPALPQYIIRLNTGTRGVNSRGVRYGTVDPAYLRVRYQPVHRVKRTHNVPGLGPIRELEQTGVTKASIILRFPAEDDRHKLLNDRGGHGLYPGSTGHFKLIERHKHVRVLRPQDEGMLAEFDRRIEAKRAELKAIQDERAAAVAQAWRRAEKVPISELEEKANA